MADPLPVVVDPLPVMADPRRTHHDVEMAEDFEFSEVDGSFSVRLGRFLQMAY